ncbi:hypothetical protein ID866_3620 [Astraeus odoratus]|nr:hypothetical protein ID866_3620 [Astraeus odoratus]
MMQEPSPPKHLVVLGAGVIGLSIAYLAATDPDVAFSVTIVARDMPEDMDSPAWASPYAGANWAPIAEGDIDPREYLPWLKSELMSRGAEFVRRHVRSIDELESLVGKHGILVNASSLGSKSIIGIEDSKLFPIRGQSLLVQGPPMQEFLAVKPDDNFMESGEVTYIIPRPGMSSSDTVLLGGTFQVGNWDTSLDMNTAQAIYDRCLELAPYLKHREGIKILKHSVGLRPAREGGARLEVEAIQFPLRGANHALVPWSGSSSEGSRTMQVVHAYGFGATGYQSSWGAAEDVMGLVKGVRQLADLDARDLSNFEIRVCHGDFCAMSLSDLGKNDVSSEIQAFKDKLASQDTENAGLKSLLLKREAELNEIKASLSETLYKLSKEADRALRLEGDLTNFDTELKKERVSRENAESALAATQEKLRMQERTTKELEATMDTLSQHSLSSNAERRMLEGDKHVLEARVRELQQMVQQHEIQVTSSNVPRRAGRPRSSSVTNFRLPALEHELSDVKTQLALKEKELRALQVKFARTQEDLVRAENLRIADEKANQKKKFELVSALEEKEDEVKALKAGGSDGDAQERESALLQRIEEDEAKIASLERMVEEGERNRASQASLNKLQSRLKAESQKVFRCEELQAQLRAERDELLTQRDAARKEVSETNDLLRATRDLLRSAEARQSQLQAELEAIRQTRSALNKEQDAHNGMEVDPTPSSEQVCSAHPDESVMANQMETLLQAIERLRNERDELKRALEFSEIEYRITTEGYQDRIASLSNELSERPVEVLVTPSASHSHEALESRIGQILTCTTAFSIVISNLQCSLESSEEKLSVLRSDNASLDSRLIHLEQLVEHQKCALASAEQGQHSLCSQVDALSAELSTSEQHRNQLLLLVAELEAKMQSLVGGRTEAETADKDGQEDYIEVRERLAALYKSYEEVETERNSLSLQVTNLQRDLSSVQEELASVQDRYNALRSQQLNNMSTSEATRTLKDHIQELEYRVLRRTEQIGIHQHDIRRLETNMKLQEDRIAEMTSELEVLAAQKDAMIEDCAEARECRDSAIQRLEVAEEEVEKLEDQIEHLKRDNEARLAEMSAEIARLTSQCYQATSSTQSTANQVAAMEVAKAQLEAEFQSLATEREVLKGQLDSTLAELNNLRADSVTQDLEAQQAFITIAVMHHAWQGSTRHSQYLSRGMSSLKARLSVLSQELLSRREDGDDKQNEVHRLHKQLAERQEQIDRLHTEVARLQHNLEETAQELAQAQATLRERDALQEEHAGIEREFEQLKERLLEEEKAAYENTRCLLQEELDEVRAQLQSSQQSYVDLAQQHDGILKELNVAKHDLELGSSSAQERLQALHAEHQKNIMALKEEHKRGSDLLSSNLDDRICELEVLKRQLEAEIHSRKRTEELFAEEVKAHENQQLNTAAIESEYRQLMARTEQHVDEVKSELLVLQGERDALNEQITNLEAEIQRLHSLTRHFESRCNESESACASLRDALHQCQLNLAQSEKAGKGAELSLALQTTQHEKVVSALRRELASLQSGPDLRTALAELEERNREMDDLLRDKCAEIEGYDDRILETLKTNKKLTAKVESLNRKVQVLQAKLTSAKSPEAVPSRVSSAVYSLDPMPSSSHPHAIPLMTVTHKAEDGLPQEHRSVFSPTAIADRETCEPPTISAGVKRRAPDDDERDTVPPEGHYPVDLHLRNPSTPRLRRTLHAKQTGFTPVRHAHAQVRGIFGQLSPSRRATTAAMPSHTITDVTNSPRSSSQMDAQASKKKSWLGRVRSGSAAQNASVATKPWTSRSNEQANNIVP